MNIVYAVTETYLDRLVPSVTSLIEHNPKAKVYIVTETDEVTGLPCDAKVINVSKQDVFPESGPNYRNRFTYINLLKVCYPDLLRIDKVIHLDADTIICDSLEPIWNTDLEGKWFAACPEYRGWYKPFGSIYYNMGVAVINLKQMRKDKAVPKLADYLNTVAGPWADQDAWNIYALEEHKAVPIDIRYNECFATGHTDDPAIVHYCGIGDWWTNKNMERREYLERYSPR